MKYGQRETSPLTSDSMELAPSGSTPPSRSPADSILEAEPRVLRGQSSRTSIAPQKAINDKQVMEILKKYSQSAVKPRLPAAAEPATPPLLKASSLLDFDQIV